MYEILSQVSMVIVTASSTIYCASQIVAQEEIKNYNEDPHPDQSTEARQTHHEDLTLCQALTFPIYASISLLILFYFFHYVQYLMLGFVIMGSSVALFQLLQYYISNSCHNIVCSRYSLYISILLSFCITLEWFRSGNLFCHDLLGCSLCILFIYTLRFPSLKIATICLGLLLVYDAFWVFFSEAIFSKNVMVEVATKVTSNPVHDLATHWQIESVTKHVKTTIELPIKLIFPPLSYVSSSLAQLFFASSASVSNAAAGLVLTSSSSSSGSDRPPLGHRFILLGLGDIALPGLLIAFAKRIDLAYANNNNKKNKDKAVGGGASSSQLEEGIAMINKGNNHSHHTSSSSSQLFVSATTIADQAQHSHISSSSGYFTLTMTGYILGLICTFVGNYYSSHAQPALIYLVPMILGPMMMQAMRQGQFQEIWTGVITHMKA